MIIFCKYAKKNWQFHRIVSGEIDVNYKLSVKNVQTDETHDIKHVLFLLKTASWIKRDGSESLDLLNKTSALMNGKYISCGWNFTENTLKLQWKQVKCSRWRVAQSAMSEPQVLSQFVHLSLCFRPHHTQLSEHVLVLLRGVPLVLKRDVWKTNKLIIHVVFPAASPEGHAPEQRR